MEKKLNVEENFGQLLTLSEIKFGLSTFYKNGNEKCKHIQKLDFFNE